MGYPQTGPGATYYLQLNFVNKVLLERSYVHSLTCCLWLLSFYHGRGEELLQRLLGPQSLKYLLSGSLKKIFSGQQLVLARID